MLQVDMTLKLQVEIKRPEFTLATDGDETKLFESEFQWLIMLLANKLPSRTDVNWGLLQILSKSVHSTMCLTKAKVTIHGSLT